MKQVFVISLLIMIITGCQDKTDPIKLIPISLSDAYPGSILDVDRIELLDGSSGDKKVIENEEVIELWINKIKDIEMFPDDNQQGRVGYIFGVSLYEGDEVKLGFIPNQINKIYYKNNSELDGHIKKLFEEQFGREF